MFGLLDYIVSNVARDGVSVLYVSPVAAQLCAHAHIYGEWMTPEQHARLNSADSIFQIDNVSETLC